jgi:hypothetical protein
MSEQSITYPADAGATTFLLTVRGVRNSATVEDARVLHNQTAGAPEGVAAARSLGDLSHNVFTNCLDHHADELLFIDFWNSLSGMGMFFADEHVQAGGNALFSKRDTPVWAPATGFAAFHLATPSGRGVGGIGLLRTTVTSLEAAAPAFSAYAAATINRARRSGQISHTVWVRVPDPGQPQPAEVIGVDTWLDADEMSAYYDRAIGFEHLGPVFAGEPDTSVWRAAAGDWVEW